MNIIYIYSLDPLKTKQVNLPGFEQFFTLAYRHQDRMFEKLTSSVSTITPLLLKVEEILVFTRTRRSPRLASYYHHWEMKLFNAIGKSKIEISIIVLQSFAYNYLRSSNEFIDIFFSLQQH